MSTQRIICDLNDIEDGSARGFEFGEGDLAQEIVLVRQGMAVYAYKNSCPHTGVSMNWQPDQFLDSAGQYIQCSVHGALFRIEDGYCVRGPCAGNTLTMIPTSLQGNKIVCEIA